MGPFLQLRNISASAVWRALPEPALARHSWESSPLVVHAEALPALDLARAESERPVSLPRATGLATGALCRYGVDQAGRPLPRPYTELSCNPLSVASLLKWKCALVAQYV